MKWILFISLFFLGCNQTVGTGNDLVKKRIDSTYVVWDTVHKPKPIDSPYYVPRKVDSPYYVPRRVDSIVKVPKYVPVPIDSPYNVGVPHYIDSIIYRFIPLITDNSLQKYLNNGNQTQVKFIITHK